MRIIAGARRGLRLTPVRQGDASAHLRPTSDRVRESLFNVLTSGRYGTPIVGARVLDLFAGTGALGFEALSRGAAHVTLVDDGKAAGALIKANTALMQAADTTRHLRRNATRLGDNPGAPFSLIFLDPPYGKSLTPLALSSALTGNWLAQNALIMAEDNTALPPIPGFSQRDSRRYGDTHITILQRIAP